jgi:CheY-like chemotaxis protein
MTVRLLVVDDAAETLRWVERMLRGRADLVLVPSRSRALNALERHSRFHGVLSDIDLGAEGRWAGLDVLRVARSRHPDAKLVGWTGHEPDAPLLSGLAALSAVCIIKGLDDEVALGAAVEDMERQRGNLPSSIAPPGPEPGEDLGMLPLPAAHSRMRRYVSDLAREHALTPAQTSALELCLLGYSREEAAEWMSVAVPTYDKHMIAVREVFGVRSNRALLARLHLLEKSARLTM